MTPTTILREAEAELWEAVEYYRSRSPGLGLDFLAEVEASIAAISQSPDRWPVREDGTRRHLTHRFPYLVVYVRLPSQIWVVAFAHCRRKHRYWADRLKRTEFPRER